MNKDINELEESNELLEDDLLEDSSINVSIIKNNENHTLVTFTVTGTVAALVLIGTVYAVTIIASAMHTDAIRLQIFIPFIFSPHNTLHIK